MAFDDEIWTETKENIKTIAFLLRKKKGIRTHNGTENYNNGHDRKHLDFFKGESFIKWFATKGNIEILPFSGICEKDATKFAQLMIDGGFIHSIKKDGERRRVFNRSDLPVFNAENVYGWDLTNDDTWGNYLLLGFVACIIGMCLLPVWPTFLKLILYYLILAYMVLFLGILFIRYALWFIVWPFGYSFWIFPRLNDDVGLAQSFKPFMTCKKSKTKVAKRLIIFASVIGSMYYITHHYNVNEFIEGNKQFMEDIYKGRLLDMFTTTPEEKEEREKEKAKTWTKSKPTIVEDIPKDDPEDLIPEPEEEKKWDEDVDGMKPRIINPATYTDEQHEKDMKYYTKLDEEMEQKYEREAKEKEERKQYYKDKAEKKRAKERVEREKIRRQKQEEAREAEKKETQDLDDEEL